MKNAKLYMFLKNAKLYVFTLIYSSQFIKNNNSLYMAGNSFCSCTCSSQKQEDIDLKNLYSSPKVTLGEVSKIKEQ